MTAAIISLDLDMEIPSARSTYRDATRHLDNCQVWRGTAVDATAGKCGYGTRRRMAERKPSNEFTAKPVEAVHS
jgi:hypothetical protein